MKAKAKKEFWVEVMVEGDESGAKFDFGKLHKFQTRMGAVGFGAQFVKLFYDTMAERKYTKKRLDLPSVASALLNFGNVVCMGHEFRICGK